MKLQVAAMDAIGKLSGGLAHDYNNMLGVILGYSELLKSHLKDEPKLSVYVNQIHNAGERGAKITKNLLTKPYKSEAMLKQIRQLLDH